MSEPIHNLNTSGLLFFIRKWRHVLITTTVLALITSFVFSLLIEEKYVSTVVLFPSTTSSISRALLNDNNYKEKDYLEFGEEEEVDQTLQLLKSNTIRDHIIEKFDLINHYDINRNSKYITTELIDRYNENIEFFRTKFMSVKIEVKDRDPQYASAIANEIADILDSVKMEIQHKMALQAYEIVKREYDLLQGQIDEMEDTLNWIRSKGVQDYSTQVEVLTDQYGSALVENNLRAAEKIKSTLDTISKYGGKYLSLSMQLRFERGKLSELKAKLAEARVNAFSVLDQKFIVNKAIPAEKPSYPVKWLIVTVSTILTFLFTLVLLILIDPKR